MRRSRDSREGTPAYEQWKIERAAEIAAEQAAAASTPEAQFQATINELHAAERKEVLTGRISDVNLAKFGTVVRGRCSEEQKVLARTEFRNMATDYVRNQANGEMLCAMVDRNGLHPGNVNSYLLCHEILKLWGGYTTESDPEPEPEVAAPTSSRIKQWKPSEQADQKYAERLTKIVVYDPMTNIGYTEYDLEHKVDSKTELRLRRLMEGRIGNERYDEYMERRDIKAAQDAERDRIAAEEQ